MKMTTPLSAIYIVISFVVLMSFVGWQTALLIWGINLGVYLGLLGLQALVRHPA